LLTESLFSQLQWLVSPMRVVWRRNDQNLNAHGCDVATNQPSIRAILQP